MATVQSAPIVRVAVLQDLQRELESNSRIILHGPTGMGKTTLANQLLENLTHLRVLSARATPITASQDNSTLIELLSSVTESDIAAVESTKRATIENLMESLAPPTEHNPCAVRIAVTELIATMAMKQPLLLFIDDAQWLDNSTIDVISYLLRRLPNERVHAILVVPPDSIEDLHRTFDLTSFGVPPWDITEVNKLIQSHGIPSRLSGRIHHASGGNPYLAELAASSLTGWREPSDFLQAPQETAESRMATSRTIDELPREVRKTLLLVALSDHPTTTLLRRAGDTECAAHLDRARDIVSIDADGIITFCAEIFADGVRDQAGHDDVIAAHRALADAENDVIFSLKHQALANVDTSAELARALGEASGQAVERGYRKLAAELLLLSAERTPADQPDKAIERLVLATQHAEMTSHTDLVRRAASGVLRLATSPADRVRAHFALMQAAGQALADLDEVFAEAEALAATEPALLAEYKMWQAWRANVSMADPHRAIEYTKEAANLAHGVDQELYSVALTYQAVLTRSVGDLSCRAILEEALAATPTNYNGEIRTSAPQMKAIFALLDYKVDESRELNLELLPQVSKRGDLRDQVGIWHMLATTEIRAGNCAKALRYIKRAMERNETTDHSPGPLWIAASAVYAAAVSMDEGKALARNALDASREENDLLHIAHSLTSIGQFQLISGDAHAAVSALSEGRTLLTTAGIIDPSLARWHSDLVEALAMTGRVAEAEGLLIDLRSLATQLELPFVLASLDRAESACLTARGDTDAAAAMLLKAREAFEGLRLPLEIGRVILTQGRLERRRRRQKAARDYIAEAAQLFRDHEAYGWLGIVESEQTRLSQGPRNTESKLSLTHAEQRLAKLVAEGASNREAAAQLYLSVKTVESTLTRVYRKVGIRSRTQLVEYMGRHSESSEQ
ncbi:AAA family ATPase [Natronoglycomyces albus]|uniref:AAA family ATPase n=1 Tax=Natronoglycomyces albus TaxID=2811108 RepID=A0A895XJT3_9ACTN|nr:LuxR family transcriptional regulator [Natronoglycomyces albus]QSB04072.1 AAA family ATPase [Natronoglycomyces albus]